MNQKDSVGVNEKVEMIHNVANVDVAVRSGERKLRTKIDLYVVPTVTLLYLMCFVDRTNMGVYIPIVSYPTLCIY
jgi:hypothetical protein